jgi:hypothetical protein
MGKSIPYAAAVQVDNLFLGAQREDHALVKSIAAPRVDQAGLAQPFQGVAEGLEVRLQISAASIADAEFLDELGILHATLREIVHALAMPVQFELVEGGGVGEQLAGGKEFFDEVGNTVAKGEMARQFDKTNQISAAPAAVTEEQILLCVNEERGMGLLMQCAESHELRPVADPLPLPMVPIQVIEQRKTLFEPLEIFAHGVHTSRSVRLEGHSPDSQPRMVGEREKRLVSATQRPGPDDSQKGIDRRPRQAQGADNRRVSMI